MSVLDNIATPADVAALPSRELAGLAAEIRQRLIDVVSQTGGHLASNLGVVELTIALLRVFTPPQDKIIWDVGHQSYTWKLLTGRAARFDTLRQMGGIAGFTKRTESEFDVFGAGHAGTALSAAVGMAVARDYRGGEESVVAVVGDAAFANGVTLEAINNLASATRRLVVILNDNEMSIGGAVGSLSQYLGRLLASPRYNRCKAAIERLGHSMRLSGLRGPYHRTEQALKSLFLQNALFEEFGLRYMGPVDGHDFGALCNALTIARDYDRPILVHVSTLKGRGFRPAEQHPEAWHGVGRFDPQDYAAAARPAASGFSQVMGRHLCLMAQRDPAIMAVTAAMCSGTGLDGFARDFSDRFFDVGICEEHAVVFAAGMATQGLRPVVAIYSTFLQRAIDCVMHDICLQGLAVIFCIDRAGVVGSDGPTHHGLFDIPMLRCLPGLVLMQPADEFELACMLETAYQLKRPVAIRYPRAKAPPPTAPTAAPAPFSLGKAVVVEEAGAAGAPIWFWALGDCLPQAREAAALLRREGLNVGVVNPRFIKPLDNTLLQAQLAAGATIVTIENGALAGGFGAAVLEVAATYGAAPARIIRFGWPDCFVPQGTVDELREQFGLTAAAIAKTVATVIAAAARTRAGG